MLRHITFHGAWAWPSATSYSISIPSAFTFIFIFHLHLHIHIHVIFISIFVIHLSLLFSSLLSFSLILHDQKQFGLTSNNGKLLRVVPLFETLTDLNNAADVCETLFSLPGYMAAIKGKQEIMVSSLHRSSTVVYCTVLYCTVVYCTVQYSAVQYSTAHQIIILSTSAWRPVTLAMSEVTI